MGKHQPQIEWRIVDEGASTGCDFVGDPLHTNPAVSAKRWVGSTCRRHIALLAVALLLLTTAIWLWHQAQVGINAVGEQLQSATEIELWSAMRGDAELATKLTVDPQATVWRSQFLREAGLLKTLEGASGAQPKVDLQVVELEDEWASVQIATNGAGGDSYRQMRFFHHTQQGWLRTAPKVTAWGEPSSLESTYFIFHFRQKDAQVVADTVGEVDALYAKTRTDLGLFLDTGNGKKSIEISPNAAPGTALLTVNQPDHYLVPSPVLYLAPATVTDAELLLQSIALVMVRDLVNEAVRTYPIDQVRTQGIDALYLWELWDADLPLSHWRDEIVHWRLGGASDNNVASQAWLPNHYDQLCMIYQLWLSSPALISIPLTCSEQERTAVNVAMPASALNSRLEILTFTIYLSKLNPYSRGELTVQPGDTVVLATLFEYIASRYSRAKIAELLAVLGKFGNWADVSQTLFSVSSTDFAHDWGEYLEARYRLDPR